MTINQLMVSANGQPFWILLVIAAIPPILTLFASQFHGDDDGNEWPWKYLYSLIIFAVFLPAIFSITLVAYAMFVISQNLLDMNVFFIIAPVATMVLTIQIIKYNKVSIEKLPGFQRLIGLVMLMGAAGIGTLLISKMRIYAFASIGDIGYIMGGLFLVMYAGYYMLFCRNDPKTTLDDL